jgi:hypothetical protein
LFFFPRQQAVQQQEFHEDIYGHTVCFGWKADISFD